MAPGKSHKYTQNNNRQEVSQFLVNRPNPRNQNLGQQDLESTNYAQQQNSAPQSHAQKVSRQQNDVNQNTNQQKASAQSSQLQQRKRPQKARQQNHQQPNPLRNDSSSQQHPSQNHQHQAARPRGNQQDFVPKSNEDNHQPNALSEGSDEQNVTALWFQGHQNPAPQSSHQRDSYQGQRCPQKPSQTNHHGSNRRQNAFILPKNPARQSSDHQKPRSISNTHSKDGVQQKREDDMQQTPRLTALQKIRDYTKEWIPNPHHRRQPFVKLPRDLALEIMDHLGPVDKASFALTTKSMWEWTKDTLKLEYFDLPGVLPARVTEKRGIIKAWPYFTCWRWRLLERLENEHWKCCSGCIRLHPKTEFFSNELVKPANERLCRAPGLIQVCPHMFLTYKKCATLQKVLSQQIGPEGETKYSPQTVDLNHYLYHECHMKENGYRVTIGTQPVITDQKQHLVFRQKYTIEFNSTDLEKVKGTLGLIESKSLLPNLCPHRSIVTHCLDMLGENSRWNIDMIAEDDVDDKVSVTCKRCCTYFSNFRHYNHLTLQKSRIDFSTSIHVGKGYGLVEDGKPGHGSPYDLRGWVSRTHLANVVEVDDIPRAGCKCRRNCRKIAFEPVTSPSPVASLPGTTWKEGGWF